MLQSEGLPVRTLSSYLRIVFSTLPSRSTHPASNRKGHHDQPEGMMYIKGPIKGLEAGCVMRHPRGETDLQEASVPRVLAGASCHCHL